MSVPRARLLDLMKVCRGLKDTQFVKLVKLIVVQARCQLFSTTFNPNGIRTGNKILRQRLRGPALAAYYPGRLPGIRDLQAAFAPLNLQCYDEKEDDRLQHIAGFVFALALGRSAWARPDQSQIESPWKGSAEEAEGTSRAE